MTILIADHVLVWMLRSVGYDKPMKQPIAYTFCKGMTKSENIYSQYKNIIRKLMTVVYVVVTFVCDQGATNVRTINKLVKHTKKNVTRNGVEITEKIIIIDNNIVVPLYDPPHLLKAIRNDLLLKRLKHTLEGAERIAYWSHIINAYCVDCSKGPFTLMF